MKQEIYRVEIQYNGAGEFYPLAQESYESYEEALAVFKAVTPSDVWDNNKRYHASSNLENATMDYGEVNLVKETIDDDNPAEDDYEVLESVSVAYFYENADREDFEAELREGLTGETEEEKEEDERYIEEELEAWDEAYEVFDKEFPVNNLYR